MVMSIYLAAPEEMMEVVALLLLVAVQPQNHLAMVTQVEPLAAAAAAASIQLAQAQIELAARVPLVLLSLKNTTVRGNTYALNQTTI